MRTPAGKECKFYYADYFRGSETQECRLIDRNPEGGRWKPSHCQTCPLPRLLLANGCPNLVLEAKVEKTLLGLREQVKVFAVCSKYMTEVAEPEIGCGHCHEELKNLRLSD